MADKNPPLIRIALLLMLALLRADRATSLRLIRIYVLIYQRLRVDLDALARAIDGLDNPTWAEVEALAAYQVLMAAIASEVGAFALVAETEIREAIQNSVASGLTDSELLAQAALSGIGAAAVTALWTAVGQAEVEGQLAFLAEGSPLFENIQSLGDDVAGLVSAKIRELLTSGAGVESLIDEVRTAIGQGLTWALNMAGTAAISGYRAALLASYRANAKVVKGWIWWAQLDERTCLSCINMHGSFFTLDETLSDHHRGRCIPLPQTVSYAELGFKLRDDFPTIQTGEAWFRSLPASRQRAMMGGAMYKAWKSGEFDFAEVSQIYHNDTYGDMVRTASLKGLIGERAKLYYDR